MGVLPLRIGGTPMPWPRLPPLRQEGFGFFEGFGEGFGKFVAEILQVQGELREGGRIDRVVFAGIRVRARALSHCGIASAT